MDFTVTKADLSQVIDLCKPATDARSTLPTGRSILFTASAGKLTGYATNVNLSVRATTVAKVKTPGDEVLLADRLRVMVRQMPDGGTLRLQVDDKHRVTLTCAGSKLRYQMGGQSKDEFPPALTLPETTPCWLPSKGLQESIARVKAAMGGPERPPLHGLWFEVTPTRLSAMALHGHKFFFFEQDGEFEAASFFLTEQSLSSVLALCVDSATVAVASDATRIFCQITDTLVVAYLPEGYRNNWRQTLDSMLKADGIIICRVDAAILLRAVRAVIAVATKGESHTSGAAIQIEVTKKGLLKLELVGAGDEVDAEDAVEVDATGAMKIMVDPTYLIEALEACGSCVAQLCYAGDASNNPLIIKSSDGFTGVLALRG